MLLRYPGGKSRGPICKRLIELIKDHYVGGVFGETFFGGGGITFQLLKEDVIDSVIINDFDKPVADLWTIVIQNPGALCRQVKLFKPTVAKFLKFKKLILDECPKDLGFEFLVVNRTSHAGRGVKAGPQGGLDQQGKYKIGCRWNPVTLVKNIWKAHHLLVEGGASQCYNQNYVDLLDAADFHYFDPPYWEVGNELYNRAFTEEDHLTLFNHLQKRNSWILSYNNHPAVIELYHDYLPEIGSTVGNGGEKTASEIILWN